MESLSPRIWNHYALADPRVEDPVRRVRYIGRTVQVLRARYKGHVKCVRDGGMSHRDSWMRLLFNLRLAPIIMDMGQGGEEREAELIAHWRALGADLTNRSTGGAGSQGYRYTDAQRAQRSKSAREVAARPGWKQKVREATTAALQTPEARRKISAGVRAHLEKPGAREKRTEDSRATFTRPDVRAKMYSPEAQQIRSKRGQKIMNSPEYREKLTAGTRASWARSEGREVRVERFVKRTSTPEVIARRLTSYSETFRERREADPLNEQIRQMLLAGLNKAEIARQLSLPYKRIVNRVIRLKEDGKL